MGEWQDIEDAPKDGRQLWLIGSGVYLGIPFTGAYRPSDFSPGSPWINMITKHRLMEHVVTHFMMPTPLPEPPPMTDNPWTSICKQLATATKGSRELDAELGALLSGPPWRPDTPGYIWCPGVGSENSRAIEVRKYTTDLNAIVAAADAEPLINCHGYDKDPTGIQAHVSRNNVSEGHFLFEGTHCTPCLALCLAFAQMKKAEHD